MDLALDRFVRVSTSPSEPLVVLSILGILTVLLLAFLAARKRPLVTFGVAVLLFGLAPTSTIIPLPSPWSVNRTSSPTATVTTSMPTRSATWISVIPAHQKTWYRILGYPCSQYTMYCS
mgnify:CR=1 FL=1